MKNRCAVTSFIIFFSTLISFFRVYGGQSTEDTFTNIYRDRLWGTNEEGQGSSGSGSTLAITELYRSFLQEFLKAYEIHSVLDFGCGDWEFSQAINWDGIDYTGVDVVKTVIKKNKKKFGKKNVKFIHMDGLQHPLPSADLLICKEVLQHLSNTDVLRFLGKLSDFTYCLITNDVDPITQTSDNPNIAQGGYRWLDLTAPPFNVRAIKVLNYNEGVLLKQVILIVNK